VWRVLRVWPELVGGFAQARCVRLGRCVRRRRRGIVAAAHWHAVGAFRSVHGVFAGFGVWGVCEMN